MITQQAPVPTAHALPIRRRDPIKAAIGFAVLLVLGAGLMLALIPDPEDSDARIAEYLRDDATQIRAVIGYFVWTAAVCCFLFFATHLRDVLRTADAQRSGLADVGHSAALVFAAVLLVSGAALVAVAGAVQMGGGPAPSVDFVRVMPQFGFGVLRVAGGLTNAVLMVTTSLVIKRTGVLPSWTVKAGYVCAVIAMLIITPLPMIAIPVWVVLIGTAMRRHAAPTA
jgi:hypothetical protein